MPKESDFARIIERVFLSRHEEGMHEVAFTLDDVRAAAADLGIGAHRQLYDMVYRLQGRSPLPASVHARAPKGHTWIVPPTGRGTYRFLALPTSRIEIGPNLALAETKVPDSTPGIIAKYALDDEQALLAKLRYNRLVDVFTGVTCYSLQSHLKAFAETVGQIEADEVYLGLDRRGAHYVLPVEAKGRNERLSLVQLMKDFVLCESKFRGLVCRPLGAQFIGADLIALFEFEKDENGIPAVVAERHYRLVPPEGVTPADLEAYRRRSE